MAMATAAATTSARDAAPAAGGRGRRRSAPGPDRLTVAFVTLAAFLALLAILAGQLRSTTALHSARAAIVLRRVYQTTVMETIAAPSASGAGGGTSVTQSVSSSGSAYTPATAPTTRTS